MGEAGGEAHEVIARFGDNIRHEILSALDFHALEDIANGGGVP